MKKVYVGLSGGVDSSVSAALLKQQGYDVTGVYMKNWTRDVGGIACPWADDLRDARITAAVLDIPFKVFDFQTAYRERVVEVMVAEYAAGRTPNPDVLCNQDIKFKLFLDAALTDGADYIATGHYARTKDGVLLRAVDDARDQTYFLYRVTEAALRRTLFPIGELHKSEVRELAASFGLPAATKPDSQGICFVGEVGIKAFLQDYLQTKPGPIMLRGQEIGRHEGAVFYTIGQRQGLGIGGGKPYYVTAKDMASNTVYVTDEPADLSLASREFMVAQTHWINAIPLLDELIEVRVRHRGGLVAGRIIHGAKGDQIVLEAVERALAPGQSAVLYQGDVVLGGGDIARVVEAIEIPIA